MLQSFSAHTQPVSNFSLVMILIHQVDLAPGIGQFLLPNLWLNSYRKIAEIVSSFYGEQITEGFHPHFNEVILRKALLSEIADLNALFENVQVLMSQGYCALLIEQLSLQPFSKAMQNKLLYALSLALGYPTPTDPRQGKLLWDVKARPLPVGHFATYSEHSERAELHTDTQYYTHPEEYFLLYTIRAARCGGGRSLLCCAHQIKEQLLSTALGREAFEVLSTFRFPFRVPTTFTEAGKIGTIETTLAPIFSDKPLIRFRYDTIEKGFQSRPDLEVPEARFALRVLLNILETQASVVDYLMGDDTLLICNNYTTLHGRTRFEDPERHLIRVRISDQPLLARQMAHVSRPVALAR
jgi:alpha-ketoglutarate-dependent taurine dioxygenase